jgi:hypothetical protein
VSAPVPFFKTSLGEEHIECNYWILRQGCAENPCGGMNIQTRKLVIEAEMAQQASLGGFMASRCREDRQAESVHK